MTAVDRPDLSDIRPGDWVDDYFSPALRPYARLARIDRPVGIWLTLFPCLAALVQASGGAPALGVSTVFCLGTVLMRSAGSTINDIADRNFDAHVERTRLRPLASGALKTRHAIVFLGAQLLLAAALLLFLSPFTRLVAICVVPLVFLYPFCKRFTYWPQAILGAAFNWSVLMAWAEVSGRISLGAIVMWLGMIAWQIAYDTIYGYVDAADDAKLGLRSTALLFGARGKLFVGLFYLVAVAAWSVGGHLNGMSHWYQAGILLVATQLAWQVARFDLRRPALSFSMFLSNIAVGAMLAIFSFAGSL